MSKPAQRFSVQVPISQSIGKSSLTLVLWLLNPASFKDFDYDDLADLVDLTDLVDLAGCKRTNYPAKDPLLSLAMAPQNQI
jgi:hypothetical protein